MHVLVPFLTDSLVCVGIACRCLAWRGRLKWPVDPSLLPCYTLTEVQHRVREGGEKLVVIDGMVRAETLGFSHGFINQYALYDVRCTA